MARRGGKGKDLAKAVKSLAAGRGMEAHPVEGLASKVAKCLALPPDAKAPSQETETPPPIPGTHAAEQAVVTEPEEEAEMATNQSLKDQMAEATKLLSDEREELAAAKKAEMANQSLKDQLAELTKLLSNEREELAAAKMANLSLKDQLAEATKLPAKKANQSLKDQLAKLTKLLSDEREEHAATKLGIKEAKEGITAAMETNHSLKDQLADEREEHAAAKLANQEAKEAIAVYLGSQANK